MFGFLFPSSFFFWSAKWCLRLWLVLHAVTSTCPIDTSYSTDWYAPRNLPVPAASSSMTRVSFQHKANRQQDQPLRLLICMTWSKRLFNIRYPTVSLYYRMLYHPIKMDDQRYSPSFSHLFLSLPSHNQGFEITVRFFFSSPLFYIFLKYHSLSDSLPAKVTGVSSSSYVNQPTILIFVVDVSFFSSFSGRFFGISRRRLFE